MDFWEDAVVPTRRGDAGQPGFDPLVEAGIIDPSCNAARDRFRLQQKHVTALAAESDAALAKAHLLASGSASALK